MKPVRDAGPTGRRAERPADRDESLAQHPAGLPPPALARWLLRRLVGSPDIDVIEGELGEAFRIRALQLDVGRARRWYWRQVAGFAVRGPVLRRLEREEGTRMSWIDGLARDLRWSIRGLIRRPTFSVVAVLTLALGIGANSAILTLVSAHFLAPLPYARADELVLLWESPVSTGAVSTVSPGNYHAWREGASAFTDVAAFNVDEVTLSGDGAAETVTASVVTPHFFDVLGASAELGDVFSEETVREAAGALVILSHDLWVRRFAGDRAVIGRSLVVDGQPHVVVGVMPSSYRQPERSIDRQGVEVWRPLRLEEQHDDFDSRFLRTVARLRAGVSLAAARDEMTSLSARLSAEHPQDVGWTVQVRTLDDYLLGDARPVMRLLLAAGSAVLLIVCANVASLNVARSQERQREFAVRAALGSGQVRLLVQLLLEGLLLATAGGGLALASVAAAQGLLQRVQQRFFTGLVDATLDLRVLALTAAVALASAVLFALPAVRVAAHAELRSPLAEGGQRGAAGRRAQRTRNGLVIGQVACATTLLIIATLLVRSFGALVSVPPGFDARGRFTFGLSVPSPTYPTADDFKRYYREVRAAVEGVPGVVALTMVSDLPFTTENRWTEFGLEGERFDVTTAPRADFHVISPDYFERMGIPVLAGRVPDVPWEPSGGEIQVAVNSRMAEMVAPGAAAVGRGFVIPRADSLATLRIAAVVGDVLDDGFQGLPEPIFYYPYGESPQRGMWLVVQTTEEASSVIEGLRRAVEGVDPDIPMAGLQTMEGMMAATVGRPRAASFIGGAFALLALLVAAAGIYGVVSHAVQSRTREIGIRAALGASAGQLMGMVMEQSGRMIGLGLVLGTGAALLAGSMMADLFFSVRWWDPASVAIAALLLGAVAATAAWLPARRAVRIDPKEALRAE